MNQMVAHTEVKENLARLDRLRHKFAEDEDMRLLSGVQDVLREAEEASKQQDIDAKDLIQSKAHLYLLELLVRLSCKSVQIFGLNCNISYYSVHILHARQKSNSLCKRNSITASVFSTLKQKILFEAAWHPVNQGTHTSHLNSSVKKISCCCVLYSVPVSSLISVTFVWDIGQHMCRKVFLPQLIIRHADILS